jgi:tetratricopeptide (TPR) repeat protein
VNKLARGRGQATNRPLAPCPLPLAPCPMSLHRLLLARLFYLWGSLHRHFGNKSSFRREHDLALRCFERAIRYDPYLYPARLDRAILLWRELGRVDEALLEFDALLAIEPDYGPALLNRALAAEATGDYRAALADLERYLSLPTGDLEDADYRAIAGRTAVLLRELLDEDET